MKNQRGATAVEYVLFLCVALLAIVSINSYAQKAAITPIVVAYELEDLGGGTYNGDKRNSPIIVEGCRIDPNNRRFSQWCRVPEENIDRSGRRRIRR